MTLWPRRPLFRLIAAGALLLAGCATLQQIAALRLVEFGIDRATGTRIAGIDLERVRSFDDLRAIDALNLAAALRHGEAPLELTLHIAARNPETNQAAARLLKLDWTLFLDDHETVSGVLDREFVIEPGTVTDIPLDVHLDLVRFFGKDVRQLVNVALGARGTGAATHIRLAARPTVTTPIGPLQYPGTITIAQKTFAEKR